MPEKPGTYKATIVFLVTENPLPTDAQVQAAILAGCAAEGLPTPASVTVE